MERKFVIQDLSTGLYWSGDAGTGWTSNIKEANQFDSKGHAISHIRWDDEGTFLKKYLAFVGVYTLL